MARCVRRNGRSHARRLSRSEPRERSVALRESFAFLSEPGLLSAFAMMSVHSLRRISLAKGSRNRCYGLSRCFEEVMLLMANPAIGLV